MSKAPGIGKRRTSQREAILSVISAGAGPLSVEQIHERALPACTSLGIATVYRAVKLLVESEQIKVVLLPDGQPRYEPSDRDHHHHFRCLDCEEVYDLPGCILGIPDGSSLPGGFEVTGHEVTLMGTCPDCGNQDS
jgi:Fur family transcriptional regulator, ferric uptake regulator